MNLEAEILKGLQERFQFRKTRGDWLQEGTCPQCNKREAFAAAKDPKVVRCGRADRCGWEDSVRHLLPDLFEDWSKRFPQSEENPDAAADAYLLHERGLDLRLLRGTYSQELYRDAKSGNTTATIRFPIGESFWERIIDRAGRFDRKAHFQRGGKWSGHCWLPNGTTFETLARADDIWIAEGIFDAAALAQVGMDAVSNMSVNPWPEHFLAALRAEIEIQGRKTRPRLVFAFDVGTAGVFYAKKHIARAKREGWDATAAQVRPDGEGAKLDWNDLLLRHLGWKGDSDEAPLGREAIDDYLHNGAITIAETPREKARLIIERAESRARAISSFDMRHGNRLWWVTTKYSEEDGRTFDVREIANCAFRLLYRERDEIADETNYFLRVDFPFENRPVKARFSSAACANSAEFKKRLMAFAGMWTGTGDQLDRIMRGQTRRLKTVEPVPFTGYVAAHRCWLLGELAVHDGRTIGVNAENYFDIGNAALKPRSTERMLEIEYDADRQKFDWLPDLWTAFGPKGLVALAFFTMSIFAVQIRARQKSLGFLEITGLPGAGKSTLIEFLWKLLGRAGYEGFDPNKATNAFIARTLVKVSNLPVGLIEGNRDDERRSHARAFDFNELLVLYNGRSPRGIGRKSGGYETDEPPFLGSIYLMQNERIDAIPAVLERLMSMNIDKARWSPATKDAAIRLEGWPIEELSGTIVHLARNEAKFLPFFFERFKHHDSTMAERVDGLHNARPVKCHSQLAAAVEALAHLFPACRSEWIAETLELIDDMALDRQQSAGGDHPLVADFWDKFEFLLSRETDDAYEKGQSVNQHRKPGEKIAVNLPHFESRCRNAGIAPPPIDQLKKVLRGSKSRKFLRFGGVNSPTGSTSKCWIFEQPLRPREPII
ncbi:toprim domain-containing protein [Pelagerythrobacter sp.]|uniref:toprim domain-containing protein n=1 Tax=Pelagerythrobacter sp. TaxID=2800702 RepID=UPI0035B4CAFA